MHDWTGFFAGLQAGHGTGDSSWIDDPRFGGASLGSHDIQGPTVGAQVGYNWQMDRWVFGAEADASWADLSGNHVDQFASDLHTTVKALGTITGRVGRAYGNHHIYLEGGGAWENVEYEDFFGVGMGCNGCTDTTRWGWVFGGGWEYAFMDNFSVKLEYNYITYGNETFGFSGGIGGNFVQTIEDTYHHFKVGVSYHF
ncbi:MAG: porin family protein [Hyphomicrobiales bacterium]|nr:porin family protein [Hyphomicrobiales bacterium]MCP5371773.1 porin family protein [Hyphomicrobiales bacterium]